MAVTPRATPLAVIGLACIFPKARNARVFWANIKNRVDAITEVPESHWAVGDYFDGDPQAPDMTYARRGGFIEPLEFDPLEYGISPNNIEATDTTQLLSMVTAREALRDAGYATGIQGDEGRRFDHDRTSVILGVTGALPLVIPLGARLGHPIWRRALRESGIDEQTTEEVVQRIADGYVPWQENSFPGLLGNVAAGRIANRFDLGGTNCVVDAACASSLSALHMAAMELESKRADMVLTGGCDTFNDIFMYMCFSKTPALSPSGRSRPFQSDGDGTALGEGLGVLVLKRLADAERDGDRIHAVVRGVAGASDGRGSAIYAPQAIGQSKALRAAYEQAGIESDTIELLEAHGTGTRVGDATELEGIMDVLGQSERRRPWCGLGSVKSMLGHTKAAAGVAGLIKTIMALEHKVLPPTLNVTEPLESLLAEDSPVYINTEARPWVRSPHHPRRAGVSAFGFGGSNFHCVVEEHGAAKRATDWSGNVVLLPLQADSHAGLAAAVEALDPNLDWDALRALGAELREAFDPARALRLCLVLEHDRTELGKLKTLVTARLGRREAGDPDEAWHLPSGAYYGAGTSPGKLAMLFPGQGSQYPGMLRDLACLFPEMLDALALGNERYGDESDRHRLSDLIYPPSRFRDADRERDVQRLTDTRTAQPAIGVVSLGAMHSLERFGVRPDAVAGHSFGELSALCAAGRLTDVELIEIANLRGSLMGELGGGLGAMAAVRQHPEALSALIERERLGLTVANYNAPEQTVLSGPRSDIERACALLSSKGVDARVLPVSAAFHSPMIAPARAPFAESLSRIAFPAGQCAVYSNVSGAAYPSDPDAARELLAEQLVRPVRFSELVLSLYEDGVRSFLEVGPGRTLTGLVGAILRDREHRALAIDGSRGRADGSFDLACALAGLAAAGHDVDLTQWDPDPLVDEASESRGGFRVTLSGANYVGRRERTPSHAPLMAGAPEPPAEASPAATPVALPSPPSPRELLSPAQAPAPAVGSREPLVSPPAGRNRTGVEDALAVTRQQLLTLQSMQEQTAHLHQQYLEGQASMQRAVERLIEQQQHLLGTELDFAPAPAPLMHGLEPEAPAHQPVLSPAPQPPLEPIPAPAAAALGPAPAPAPTVVTVAGSDQLMAAVLEVVSEKTGYPTDMLTAEMSLDADLGIDSIKRVEILSALTERLPQATQVSPQALGDLVTLGDIALFIGNSDQRSPTDPLEEPGPRSDIGSDLGSGSDPAPSAAFAESAAREIERALLETVADKTGYPVDMLQLEQSLDVDLGIDSIKRVEIMSALRDRLPDTPEVGADALSTLHTLGEVCDFLRDGAQAPAKTPGREVDALATVSLLERQVLQISELPTNGRRRLGLAVGAGVWITDDGTTLSRAVCDALVAEHIDARLIDASRELPSEPVAGLVIIPPAPQANDFAAQAFALLRHAGPGLRQSARDGGATLMCVCRLDGAFGLNGKSPADPASGALAGLVKTAAREWPEVACKALDIADDVDTLRAASEISEEFLVSGPVEVGLSRNGRCQLVLSRSPLGEAPGQLPIEPRDLVVITGGARGITAHVATALASACQPSLLLLGRTDIDEAEPEWLAGISENSAVKEALAAHWDGPEPLSPAELERRHRQISASREVRGTLTRARDAGAQVLYRALDIRDPEAVGRAVADARGQFGPVRGIIHAAGVIADRLIEDKTESQFADVFSTKVGGLLVLLKAVGEDDLRILSLFSSSSGRFGRRGQIDYAAANEVLNKIAQQQARKRPTCRVLSLNWGPWDGGMVTPQLRRLFEREGVGVIPLEAGANHLLRELATPTDGPVEIVITANPGPGRSAA